MAFKMPTILLPNRKEDPKLPKFTYNDVVKGSFLGRGAFASAFHGKYKGEDVVLKELNCTQWDSEGKKFLKEARIINDLPLNEYVVSMIGVCYQPLTIMLKYCCFSFIPFSKDISVKVNSLDQYLKFVDSFDVKGFEPFSIKCATDIIKGVSYLHENNIAHRDLKPSNVLVCNRHYSDIVDISAQQNIISTCPIICKLTDFGESRSSVYQTHTVLSTKADNTDKGTIPFMAPEILPGGCLIKPKLEDLFKVDIWALGMTLFTILNPDLRYPFMLEWQGVSAASFEAFIGNCLNVKKQLPSMSEKYALKGWQEWSFINSYYYNFIRLNPTERPFLSSTNIRDMIPSGNIQCRNLSVSQETSMVKYSEDFANNRNPVYPSNDGTNSCSFLCYKFLITMASIPPSVDLSDTKMVAYAENIIRDYPKTINILRDTGKSYDIEGVKSIINKVDDHAPPCELLEFCTPGLNCIFSASGVNNLINALQRLGKRGIGLGIYISDPYSFAVYTNDNRFVILDTHPVPQNCGGNHMAQLVKTRDKTFSSVIEVCSWILRRLALSSNSNTRYQSMSVLDIKR